MQALVSSPGGDVVAVATPSWTSIANDSFGAAAGLVRQRCRPAAIAVISGSTKASGATSGLV